MPERLLEHRGFERTGACSSAHTVDITLPQKPFVQPQFLNANIHQSQSFCSVLFMMSHIYELLSTNHLLLIAIVG